MTIYIYALIAVLMIVIAALVPLYLRHRRERKVSDAAWSHLRRSADGELYVIDPQTGTMHKLSKVIAARAAREAQETSTK